MIQKGNWLFLWRENDEIVLYQWVMFSPVTISYLDLEGIQMPDEVCYWSSAYVPSKHAGRLVLKRAMARIEELCRERGKRCAFCFVKDTDPKVNRYHEKVLKTVQYQRVVYIKIFGLRCYKVTQTATDHSTWYCNSNSFWNAYASMF